MRKDVKIGLAIGGVLLAVLVVYLLVPKDAGRSDQYGRGDDLSTTSPENNPDAGAIESGGGNSGGAAPDGSDGGSQNLPPTGGQADQPPAVADATTPDNGAAATADGPSDGPGGTFDWDAMLTRGVMPDKAALMATGSQPAPPAGQTTGTPGQIPQNDPFASDPGEEPNWNNGNTVGGPAGAGGSTPPGGSPRFPAQPVSPVPSAPAREHTVQPNETLSSIALAAYGDSRHYRLIEKANAGLDPRKLRPGMVIKLPDPAVVRAEQTARGGTANAATAQQQAPVDPAREYRIQPGDSLYKISMRLYGRGDKSDALYAANRDRIGNDSARLKVGTVIKLPEPPTVSPTATR